MTTDPPCCPGTAEQWKAIPGHPHYEASDHGRVRNVRTMRVLRPQRHTRGYLKVTLGRRPGETTQPQITVHRAVALAWVPLPIGDLFAQWHVDHIDFTRRNNHATNLRWLRAEHNRHRYHRDAIAADEQAATETPPMSAAEQAEYDARWAAAGW